MVGTRDLKREAVVFLTRLFSEMSRRSLRLPSHWDIDHVCYRVGTYDRYEEMKRELGAMGVCLTESEVNGRPIATFKLESPIHFQDYVIDLVELPAPKPGRPTREGFEHFEVVCDVALETIPHFFRVSSFNSKGMGKLLNAEIELEFSEGNIKFHNQSLASVIRLETHADVSRCLEKTQILKRLAGFAPVVVGTFPLNLNTAESDLDVLVGGRKYDEIKSHLQSEFSREEDFEIKAFKVNQQDVVVASFRACGLRTEIFATETAPLSQPGFQHFQVEEKLLKYRGAAFESHVRELKNRGLKTEVAFCTALELSGDPYQRLLELNKLPVETLRKPLIP